MVSFAAAAEAIGSGRVFCALVGFDGFTDAILHAVRSRATMRVEDFSRIETITEFAERVGGAAGKSTNIELVRRELRFGGNGPLMASGLAGLGARVSYVGSIGVASDDSSGHARVDPIFAEFAKRCERVIAIGVPGHTDAVEFADGKIMFNHTANVQAVTWEAIVSGVGLREMREMVGSSVLLGVVNWSLLGGVPGIWRGLMRDVLMGMPTRVGGVRRRMFVDLSDPAKRTDGDIAGMLVQLREMEGVVAVTLGLNLAEAQRVAKVVGVRDDEAEEHAQRVARLASGLRDAIGIDTVVVHPREGAAAASAGERSVWVDGPVTANPKLSTGAGDHFNAGFAFAQASAMPLEQCVAAAAATSGAYVRDAASPTRERVAEMLRGGW
ncbi:hypothetical protein LBMAG48_20850 [Phycisphaerae bacterium]|nr:hypothetical protein LBMAG48_20850 [Phycisphaerae bacterium]